MKLTIAGGGTGGHISPAIAVAQAMDEIAPSMEIDFIATPRPVDARMYKEYGSAVHVLDPPRIDRGITDLLLLPFRGIRQYMRARGLLKRLGTEVLFATGGYPSFFPILAAGRMGIPTAIHESNSIPGRSNLMSARFADLVMTGFRSAGDRFRGDTLFTGNPVRPSMRIYTKAEARKELELPDGVPVVLFLGGSQGARAVNDLALEAPEGVQVVLQCGSRDLDRVRDKGGGRKRMRIYDFVDSPDLFYSAADIAVARSGAMTVAELAWFRLPAVFIPYPYAADDHQRWNAAEVASAGGAVVMDQNGLQPQALWNRIGALLDGKRLRSMGSALESLMPENPAYLIARAISALIGKDGGNG